MDKKYNFSVIISCYNLGELLPKAINSVFMQTLGSVEVIVVDDASTDQKTREVLEELGDDVKLICLEKNSGVSVARNTGVKIASSPYILCLDADDTIEPTYLEKVKNIFDADESVGLVSCWAQYFGDDDWLWKPRDNMLIGDFLSTNPLPVATCFRKNLHDKCGGYDAELRGYEDWEHWIRIAKQGCKTRVIPEVLFNYYVRLGSKVKTSNKNAVNIIKRIVNSHRDLYEVNMDDVIAQKHYNWVMSDMQCKGLNEQLKNCGCGRKNSRFFRDSVLGSIVTFKKKIFSRKII